MNSYIYLLIYVVLINILAFSIMSIDKNRATNGNSRNRISEKTLFTYALFLGALGIFAGMYAFRHKTKHMKFVIFIPVLFILNCISIYYIITRVFPMINT